MDQLCVVGVGMHRFGKFPDLRIQDLARVAIWDAIEDAGIDPRLIDIAYVANCYSGLFTSQHDAVAPMVVKYAGLTGMPMIHVMGGSGSGSAAFHEAAIAVGSGQYRFALAVGVEKIYAPGDPARSISAISTSADQTISGEIGLTMVGELTMSARRLMERYGWTQRDFALVAVKNRANGALNPLAEIQEPLTIEQVLSARVVAEPLTRPMCAGAAVDGAAAAIVCSLPTAKELGLLTVPWIRSMVLVGGSYLSNRAVDTRLGMLSMDEAPRAFATAYERAGVGPEDLEMALVHDAVAPEEMLAYQVLGLCKPGDEASLLHSGATSLTGRVPFSTDGGLLARGHPIAATGLAQVYEAALQLRGRAGSRQAYPRDGHPPRIAALQNAGAQGGAGGGVAVSAAILLAS